jgi:hypothetical protein
MGQPLPVFIVGRPAEYDGNSTADKLFDGAGNSYWATPPNTPLPQVITLQLQAPALVEQVMINGYVPGYENCCPSDVAIEVAMAGNPGAWFAAGRGFVPMGQTGSIPVQAPGPVEALRIVIQANHGGPMVAAAEMAVIGSSAGGAKQAFGAPVAKQEKEPTKLGWQPPKEEWSDGAQQKWQHPDAGKAQWSDPNAGKAAWSDASAKGEYNDPAAKAGWGGASAKSEAWQAAPESTKVGWTPPKDDANWDGAKAGGAPGIGARVVAERYEGGWFEGTVTQANAGMYEVAWDDGTPPQWLKAEQVQFQ